MERSTIEALLGAILDQALTADNADFGNIQMMSDDGMGLVIVVHKGFSPEFLRHFSLVRWDEGSACAMAYRHGSRVLIADVRDDPAWTSLRDIARQSGFVAVQCTPLKDAHGGVLGMLSTHFARPIESLSPDAEVKLDQCAAAASRLLQEHLAKKAGPASLEL